MENKPQLVKSNFRAFNEKGERIYEVEEMINYLSNKEGKSLIRDLCSLIGEERRDLLEQCFQVMDKKIFLKLVEKSLVIQNEGGVEKKTNNTIDLHNEKKTTGGILFRLIKKEGEIAKDELKQIFKKDYHAKNQRRKIIKNMEKLIINDNIY